MHKRLHEIMREGAGIFRNEAGLKKALLEIDRLSREQLRAATARNLADCCSVRNACTTAMLVCRAALLRRESRGAHMRTDTALPQNKERSPFGHTFHSLSRRGSKRGIGHEEPSASRSPGSTRSWTTARGSNPIPWR
jgi:fumarate reductase (CoM/CoB) subunit A